MLVYDCVQMLVRIWKDLTKSVDCVSELNVFLLVMDGDALGLCSGCYAAMTLL